MKIVGELKPWTLERTCPYCKTVLLIESSDLKSDRFVSMGESEIQYYVNCVSCDGIINFGEYCFALRSIPSHILNKANKAE